MTPQEAHKSGLSLKDALDKYGIWRRYNNKEYSPPHELPDNWENDPAYLGGAIGNLVDAAFEPGRRRYEVQQEFRRQLENGKLIGIGYLSPRQINHAPQLIPADIWQLGKINFEKSEIENESLKFEGVRIIKPSKNKKISGNKQSPKVAELRNPSPNPVGRPSSREKIFAVYEELKSNGKIDFSKPMTHAYPAIRAHLVEKYGTEKGFKNEAIRIAITKDFQAEAERLNST
ncbi:hypothetical protein [Hyphococcus sp.]|uniref:hypothetical protein n=1 Tax=Hyphococcus sp. TaxID=2038636 RepID=UPI003CCC04FB